MCHVNCRKIIRSWIDDEGKHKTETDDGRIWTAGLTMKVGESYAIGREEWGMMCTHMTVYTTLQTTLGQM